MLNLGDKVHKKDQRPLGSAVGELVLNGVWVGLQRQAKDDSSSVGLAFTEEYQGDKRQKPDRVWSQ